MPNLRFRKTDAAGNPRQGVGVGVRQRDPITTVTGSTRSDHWLLRSTGPDGTVEVEFTAGPSLVYDDGTLYEAHLVDADTDWATVEPGAQLLDGDYVPVSRVFTQYPAQGSGRSTDEVTLAKQFVDTVDGSVQDAREAKTAAADAARRAGLAQEAAGTAQEHADAAESHARAAETHANTLQQSFDDFVAADQGDVSRLTQRVAANSTKLDTVESGAEVNPTGAEIVTDINTQLGSTDWQSGGTGDPFITSVDSSLHVVGGRASVANPFTEADETKLDGIEADARRGAAANTIGRGQLQRGAVTTDKLEQSLADGLTADKADIADLKRRTADLSDSPDIEWADVPRVELGGFYMTGINDGDPVSGFGVSHTANTRGPSDFYNISLLIPTGADPHDYRLYEADGDVTPTQWSQGPHTETIGGVAYDRYEAIQGPAILPRGTTVKLQQGEHATQFTGNVPTPTRDAAPATKAYVDANAGGADQTARAAAAAAQKEADANKAAIGGLTVITGGLSHITEPPWVNNAAVGGLAAYTGSPVSRADASIAALSYASPVTIVADRGYYVRVRTDFADRGANASILEQADGKPDGRSRFDGSSLVSIGTVGSYAYFVLNQHIIDGFDAGGTLTFQTATEGFHTLYSEKIALKSFFDILEGLTDDNEQTVRGHIGVDSTPVVALTSGAAINWAVANRGSYGTLTLDTNATLTIQTGTVGGVAVLEVKQDSAGSRTLTLHSSIRRGSVPAPVLSTTANATDLLFFVRTTSVWAYLGIIKGIG